VGTFKAVIINEYVEKQNIKILDKPMLENEVGF
jgi:hypothetical protein